MVFKMLLKLGSVLAFDRSEQGRTLCLAINRFVRDNLAMSDMGRVSGYNVLI